MPRAAWILFSVISVPSVCAPPALQSHWAHNGAFRCTFSKWLKINSNKMKHCVGISEQRHCLFAIFMASSCLLTAYSVSLGAMTDWLNVWWIGVLLNCVIEFFVTKRSCVRFLFPSCGHGLWTSRERVENDNRNKQLMPLHIDNRTIFHAAAPSGTIFHVVLLPFSSISHY